jgi:hypothetical protein
MPVTDQPDPCAVVERLRRAWNAHDLEALVACFHSDYESIQPLHPDCRLQGSLRIRLSWGEIFRAVPDLRADLIRDAITDGLVWTEWRWRGTYVEGHPFEAGGVMIFGIVGDKIKWARVYTGTLQIAGPDFDLILDEILGRASAPAGN